MHMKTKNILLLTFVALLVTSCGLFIRPTSKSNSSNATSQTSTTSVKPGTSTTSTGKTSSSKDDGKVIVPKHTLSDSNPPIDVNSKGEEVSETVWNSFRSASNSKFNGNYNYTYYAYSGGNQTLEAFTKNGYYMQSSAGKLYYERKSGNTFYQYIAQGYNWLRQETTLDIQQKYTQRIVDEIYVHMFDFENYYFDDEEGTYEYRTTTFGTHVKFQGGYLTNLFYALGANIFEIRLSFQTTIEIPESYYYK